MSAAIDITDLTKKFGTVTALDQLNLRVETGQIHGFLGPNGAGKSTTIRILLGILQADSGTVKVLGQDPWKRAASIHSQLAYVPGDVELWPNLTGGQALDLLGRLHRSFSKRRREELIDAFDLDPTKKCRTYSKGNRQKVAIISALASDAELLLLDEPTAGLDPLMEVVFQQTLGDLREDGRTVLLSSHILAQVEKLADTVSIIRRGTVVQSGTLEQMRHLNRTHVDAHTARPVTGLASLAGLHDVQQEQKQLKFSVDGEHLDAAIAHLAGFGFTALSCHPPTLEELMLSHYGDELRAHSGHEHRAAQNGVS